VVTSAFTSLGSIIEAMPKNLVSGVAKVTDDGLKLTGIYVSEEQKSAFEAVATAAVPSDGATPGTAPAGSTDEGTGGTQKAADSNNPLAPLATDLSPRPVATEEDAAAVQARLNEVLAGRVIPFAPGSAALLPEAQPILQEVSAAAKQFAGLRISVDGHTDSDGADAANQALSQARAESVLSALIADGVPAEQLTAIGYGETQPLVPNDSPANKAQNRRVVFTVGKA
jgi:outer membrane protein OmpA-like peptidoglycan-associated protein